MGMFDRYKNIEGTVAHSNIFAFPPRCFSPIIVVGGTSTITFEIPMCFLEGDSESELSNIKLIIFKEATVYTEKTGDELEVYTTEDLSRVIVSCTLEADETITFKDYKLLDTFVQVVFDYHDDTIFSDKFKINVIDTLERGN